MASSAPNPACFISQGMAAPADVEEAHHHRGGAVVDVEVVMCDAGELEHGIVLGVRLVEADDAHHTAG